MTNTNETLGFIGLGVMGERMCRNLVRKSGRKVVIFDLRPEPIAALKADGAETAGSVAEVARRADIAFLSLPGTEHVEAVCLGPDGLLANARPGLAIVDTSTNGVSATRALAEKLEAAGIAFADAPVARTRHAAEAGTLSITVGATPELFQRIEGHLGCMGSDVTLCGPVGTGQVVKIINNMLVFEIVLAVSEALTLGRRAGMDGKLLLETLQKGSSNSFVLQQHAMKALLPGDFPVPAFGAPYVLKDLSYALQLGDETGVALDYAHLAERYYTDVIGAGYGAEYFPAVIKLIEQLRPPLCP